MKSVYIPPLLMVIWFKFLFILIPFLGIIDIPEKIKLRRPSEISLKKLHISNDDLIELYSKFTSFLCNSTNTILDVNSL